MPCTAEKPAAAPPAGVGPQPPRRQAPAQHDRNHLTCRSDARLPARRIRWPLRRRLIPRGAVRSKSGHNPDC